MDKSPEAFRTISEVAETLETPAHVLRFWESRFPQIRPVKRAGGRRYYRPADVALLSGIRRLLHDEGMTIRGVQKILREQGVRHVAAMAAAGEAVEFDAEVLDGEAVVEAPATAQVFELGAAARQSAPSDAAAGEVVRLRAAPEPVVQAPVAAVPPVAEEVPEAGHVWVDDEPELELSGPVNLFAAAPTEPPGPEPAAQFMDQATGLEPKLSGIAARLRALPRPTSAERRPDLIELHSRLGLLHAQMAEALRLRR